MSLREFLSTDRVRAVFTKRLLIELGLMVKVESNFMNRLKVQKYVYFLQLHPELKGRLNYNFNLYVRGPYSPDLAYDYYRVFPDISEEEMAEAKLDISDKLREYAKTLKSLNLPQLEIASTLMEARRLNPKSKIENIIELVHSIKPTFTKEEIREVHKICVEMVNNHKLSLE